MLSFRFRTIAASTTSCVTSSTFSHVRSTPSLASLASLPLSFNYAAWPPFPLAVLRNWRFPGSCEPLRHRAADRRDERGRRAQYGGGDDASARRPRVQA